ncbi:MAG: indole-3-glycerol-phosphate synthase [Candidatus Bathyarchaeota archaeon]|nr:MAG: indole-3-glycerol-phosphate synthase [Candidatus Bathyarchaeota archaeon]
MADFLDTLARNTLSTIAEGYYNNPTNGKRSLRRLSESIVEFDQTAIITEVKFASPTLKTIGTDLSIESLATSMEAGGAVGISVLTEPKHFMGTLSDFTKVRRQVKLPLLMKDVFLNRDQVDAASTIGADAVLLIQALYDRAYCECTLEEMIDYAHSKGLEVLLETHDSTEFESAMNTTADLIGINNRDLRTLKVDLNNTKTILHKKDVKDRVVVSESGIKTKADIQFLLKAGARAFLIGSAIMKANDVEQKVRELVSTL